MSTPPAALRAGVLIGGLSRRMGRDKTRIEIAGESLALRVASRLAPPAADALLIGNRPPPEDARSLAQLADLPGVSGPLAGILAAFEHDPRAAWLIAAGDMPELTREAAIWLSEQRRENRWAVLPRLRERGVEPLFAIYEPKSRPLLEELAASDRPAPSRLEDHARVAHPRVPDRFAAAWTNLNTPVQLERLLRREPGTGKT